MKILPAILAASFMTVPILSEAQTSVFPEGTARNEHNINGAEYPRIDKEGRAHFKVYAPDAKKWKSVSAEK